ncbi:Autism Susceptibility 2 Protein [Manis pentadactyla]|nr:Autism Susceptibility 2 Protein [Manis pentadactyla]
MQVRYSQSKGGTRTLVTHKGKATRTPETLKQLSIRASGLFLGSKALVKAEVEEEREERPALSIRPGA